MNHFNLAFLSNTQFISLAFLLEFSKLTLTKGTITSKLAIDCELSLSFPSVFLAFSLRFLELKRARPRYFRYFCLILSIMSSKRQIGRASVFHLQNQGHITTENDFPAV